MMAQTTATNRGPKGWDRLVAQLNAATDATSFHHDMLDLQCKIVAAEYGVMWVLEPGTKEVRAADFWPDPANKPPADSPLMTVLSQAVKQGFDKGTSQVLRLEAESGEQPTDLGAHVFVTVMRAAGKPVALTTVVAECRDQQVLQTTAPLRELAAGLYDGFAARLDAVQRDVEAGRTRQALAILAVSQEAVGFTGSCLNLVNELARQLSCTRVSLGWIKGRSVKLVAMSDTEYLRRHSEQVALIELSMAECLDQQHAIVCPAPDDVEPLLKQAVVHAHKRLVTQPGQHVLSLPLRHRDEWVGVLTLERGEGFDAGMIQYLQLVADVVAPQLDDRRQSDKLLVGHAWHSVEISTAYVLGPKHAAWKLGAVAALVVLVVILLGSWDYRVSAPFVFEAHSRRILPSPFEGRIEKVNVKPGWQVKAGDVLAQLDTHSMMLELKEAQSKRTQADLEYNQKMVQYSQQHDPSKESDALQSRSERDQMDARIALLQYQIDQATIRSPLDGWVLAGDWYDKTGGVIKQGEEMFEVAPLNDLTAILHVGESDISEIDSAHPQTGRLATRSVPEETFEFKTERVVPAAAPINGINSFEVRARFDDTPWEKALDFQTNHTIVYHGVRYVARTDSGPSTRRGPVEPGTPAAEGIWGKADWLRPNMEGLAKIDAGRKPLYWIFTHRIADILRLWFWW